MKPRLRSISVLACSAVLAASVPLTYAALGGGSYAPALTDFVMEASRQAA